MPFRSPIPKHRRVDVRSSRFESAVGVRDSAACVIVEMSLGVAADDFAQDVNLMDNFPWCSRAHGVGDTHTIDSQPIDAE